MSNLHADGVTDDAPAIQALLDAGGTVQLPTGDIALYRPLVMKNGMTLRGDPDGRTRLFGYFGSGHLVVCQPMRPMPDLSYRPHLLLSSEPGTDLSTASTMSVAFSLRRKSAPPAAAVHVHCSSDYGIESHEAWGVWDFFGGLRVWWGNTSHEVYGVAQGVDVPYRIELAYNGTAVTLSVDGTVVLSFPATGKVPQYPNGVDAVAIGFNPAGPHGVVRSHVAADAWITDFVLSADGQVRLALNLSNTDGPFLVGTRGDGKFAYIVPDSTETQGGQFQLADLTFMGAFGASGPLYYDAIFPRGERLQMVNTWFGVTFHGTTYGGVFREIAGTSRSVHWLQVGQSMATTAESLSLAAAGIPFLASGAVGGTYTRLFVTPYSGAYCSIYVRESGDVAVFGGQVDDEGGAGAVRAAVVSDLAAVTLYAVQMVRQTVGPVICCARGGTVHVHSGWLASVDGTQELIHFSQAPVDPSTVIGSRLFPSGTTLTLYPSGVKTL